MNHTDIKGASTIHFSINQEPLLNDSLSLRFIQAFDAFTCKVPGIYKIDMNRITNINSTGLVLLLELKKISLQKRIGLEFINIPQPLLSKLEEAGLKNLLY